MSWAEYVADQKLARTPEYTASLTVGTAVTWMVESDLGDERIGTIVEICGGAGALVQAASGEEDAFSFCDLRLA